MTSLEDSRAKDTTTGVGLPFSCGGGLGLTYTSPHWPRPDSMTPSLVPRSQERCHLTAEPRRARTARDMPEDGPMRMRIHAKRAKSMVCEAWRLGGWSYTTSEEDALDPTRFRMMSAMEASLIQPGGCSVARCSGILASQPTHVLMFTHTQSWRQKISLSTTI